MSMWTEERVDTLRRLLADGLSCSQVAARLGDGVTRNAVIGKAIRLGIADRNHSNFANTQQQRPTAWRMDEIALLTAGLSNGEVSLRTGRTVAAINTKRANLGLRAPKAAAQRAETERARITLPMPPNRSHQATPYNQPQVKPGPRKAPPVTVAAPSTLPVMRLAKPRPPAGTIGILEIKNGLCREVHGDPGRGPWHFCGAETHEKSRYCLEHHLKNYIPVRSRVPNIRWNFR